MTTSVADMSRHMHVGEDSLSLTEAALLVVLVLSPFILTFHMTKNRSVEVTQRSGVIEGFVENPIQGSLPVRHQ